MILPFFVKAKTWVTIDLGIHPKHAGDPMCLRPDLATASALGLEIA
jgi:hypothetical protein